MELTCSSIVTGLSPNTTYHWRFRFVTTTGVNVVGADQQFTMLQKLNTPTAWDKIKCWFFNCN
jgi:hypothetical protein